MPFGTSSQLGEALSAGQVGQLIQKRIDPHVVELFRRFSQFTAMVPTLQWDSNVYNWNSRQSLPPGGFVRDGGARPLGNSVWTQANVNLANMQSVGSVTGFAQAVTRSLIGDLFRTEYDAAAKGLTFDIETGLGWGNAGATAYGPWPQFDGLASLVNQFNSSNLVAQNALEENGAALTLGMLDRLIDMVRNNSGMPVGSDYMFVMTPTAVARIEQQLMSLQRYVDKTTVDAGLQVSSYKGIPFAMSSFLGTTWSAPMGAVAATPGTTGGSMAAGNYSYVIVPIMARAGLGSPSIAVPATTTGTTGTVSLSFTPPVGPQNSMPLLYEVYRGTTAGQETLLGVVDAVASVQADNITPNMTTGIIDTGSALTPTWNAGTMVPNPGQTPPAYVGGGTGQKVRVTGGEDIFLIPRDPDILVRPYVRDVQMVPVSATINQPDAMPFALVTDCALAVRGPQFVGRMRNSVATLTN